MTSRPLAAGPAGWDWLRLRALCLREAQRVLGRGAAAEDAAQEAAIRAWRQRSRCLTPDRPEPWITTIARREALRIAAQSSETPYEEHHHEPVPTHALEIDTRVDVQRAMLGLSPEDRGLLLARYWHDLTQDHAAVVLNLPAGTVKVRLHRLRKRLREVLAET
jgi:RNA polymerase sigma-70 factor (ECF subfamily)